MSAGVMALSMIGCGNTATSSANSSAASDAASAAQSQTESMADASTAKKTGIKVGIEMKTLDGAFFTAMVDAFEKGCEERGWEYTVLNADSDTMKESENMDTFITGGYDLVIIDPYETEGCVEAINRVADAGIPVICVDNSCGDAANVVSIVYPDNVQNGLYCGSWVAENVFGNGEEIRSVCIGGQKDLEAARERRMGMIAGILMQRLGLSQDEAIEQGTAMEKEVMDKGSATNTEANFSVLGIGWGNYTANGGLDAAEDLVVANPTLNFMFGENDAMLLGAMTAIENAGLTDQVYLAADADGQKEALELIKNGSNYVCTGNNKPEATRDAALEIADKIINEGADPTSFDRTTLTNPACISKDNVDEFYDANSAF